MIKPNQTKVFIEFCKKKHKLDIDIYDDKYELTELQIHTLEKRLEGWTFRQLLEERKKDVSIQSVQKREAASIQRICRNEGIKYPVDNK